MKFKALLILLRKAITTRLVINMIGDLFTGLTKTKVDDKIWAIKKALDTGDSVKIEQAILDLGYTVKVEFIDNK